MTECTQESFEFAAHFSRRMVAEFSSDRLTTDGGSLLLRQVDRRIGLLRGSIKARGNLGCGEGSMGKAAAFMIPW